MKALLQKRDKIFYLAGLLFLVGCAARLVALTSLPNGLNQDEAYAGYNAWCIPVSYTHLDVYKRQAPRRAVCRIRGC